MWRAPKIHRGERREMHILVEASDNVLVTQVRVTGLDNDEKVLVQGEGVRSEEDWWEFASNADGKIIA